MGALSSYLGVSGSAKRKWDGVLYLDSATRWKDVIDGTSNTLLVGERPPSSDGLLGSWYGGVGQLLTGSGDNVLSVREQNYYYPPTECPRGPYEYRAGRLDEFCDAFHFWSLHAGGANFTLCDCSTRFLKYSANALMPALSTRASGEAVSPSD